MTNSRNNQLFSTELLAILHSGIKEELSELPFSFSSEHEYRQIWRSYILYSIVSDINSRKPNDFTRIYYQGVAVHQQGKTTTVHVTYADDAQRKQVAVPTASLVSLKLKNIKQSIFGYVEKGNISAESNSLTIAIQKPITQSVESISLIEYLTPWKRAFDAVVSKPFPRFFPTLLTGKSQQVSHHATLDISSISLDELNKSQRQAVKQLCRIDLNPSVMIGPPGTGKTTVILKMVEVVEHRIRTGFHIKKNAQVVIATSSNKAAHVLAARLMEKFPERHDIALLVSLEKKAGLSEKLHQLTSNHIVRTRLEFIDHAVHAINESKETSEIKSYLRMLQKQVPDINDDINELLDSIINEDNLQNNICTELTKIQQSLTHNRYAEKVEEKHIAQASIVITTHSMASLITGTREIILLCDEVGQSTDTDILISMTLPCVKACVLVGDPRQLPPTVILKEAQDKHYNRSMLERLEQLRYNHIGYLETQYRCPERLVKFINKHFYAGRLKSHISDDNYYLTDIERKHQLFKFIDAFIDVPGQEEKQGTSYFNEAEADVIIQCLLKLKEMGTPIEKDAVIITLYKSQKNLLKQKLCEAKLDVPVETADSEQGDEARITFISFVRANPEGRVGFARSKNRLNVILSRAKGARFCFGNAATLIQKKGILAKMVKYYMEQDALLSIKQFARMQANQAPLKRAVVLQKPYQKSLPFVTRQIELGVLKDQDDCFQQLLNTCATLLLSDESHTIKNYVHRLMAKIYYKQRKFNAAVGQYEQLVTFNTDQFEYEKAKCYFQLGDSVSLNLAIQLLEPLVKGDHVKANLLILIAQCHTKLGFFSDALAYFARAEQQLQQQTHLGLLHSCHLEKAYCYYAMENYQKAHDLLENLYVDSANLQIRVDLLFIRCCMKVGLFSKAKTLHTKRVEQGIKGHEEAARHLQIEILIALGEIDEAIQLNQAYKEKAEAKSTQQQIQHLTQIGRTYYLLKKYDDAITWYQQALALDSLNESTQLNLINCYLIMHQPNQALNIINMAKNGQNSLKRDFLIKKMHCYIGLNDFPKASAFCYELLADYPDDLILRHEINMALNKMENEKNTLEEAEAIYAAAPDGTLYQYALNSLLAASGSLHYVGDHALDEVRSLSQAKNAAFQEVKINGTGSAASLVRTYPEESFDQLHMKAFWLYKIGNVSEARVLCKNHAERFPELLVLAGIIQIDIHTREKKKAKTIQDDIAALKKALVPYPYSYHGHKALLFAYQYQQTLQDDDIHTIKKIIQRFPDKIELQLRAFTLLIKHKHQSFFTLEKYQDLCKRFSTHSKLTAIDQLYKQCDPRVIDEKGTVIEDERLPTAEFAKKLRIELCLKINKNLYQDILTPLLAKDHKLVIYGGYLTDLILQKRQSNDFDFATDRLPDDVERKLGRRFRIIKKSHSPVESATYFTLQVDPARYGVEQVEIQCYLRDKFPKKMGAYEFDGLQAVPHLDASVKITPETASYIDTILPPEGDNNPRPCKMISEKPLDPMLPYLALNGLTKIPGASLAPEEAKKLAQNSYRLNTPELKEEDKKRLVTKIYRRLTLPNADKFFENMLDYRVTNIFNLRFEVDNHLTFMKHILQTQFCKRHAIPIPILFAFIEYRQNTQLNIPELLVKYDVQRTLIHLFDYEIKEKLDELLNEYKSVTPTAKKEKRKRKGKGKGKQAAGIVVNKTNTIIVDILPKAQSKKSKDLISCINDEINLCIKLIISYKKNENHNGKNIRIDCVKNLMEKFSDLPKNEAHFYQHFFSMIMQTLALLPDLSRDTFFIFKLIDCSAQYLDNFEKFKKFFRLYSAVQENTKVNISRSDFDIPEKICETLIKNIPVHQINEEDEDIAIKIFNYTLKLMQSLYFPLTNVCINFYITYFRLMKILAEKEFIVKHSDTFRRNFINWIINFKKIAHEISPSNNLYINKNIPTIDYYDSESDDDNDSKVVSNFKKIKLADIRNHLTRIEGDIRHLCNIRNKKNDLSIALDDITKKPIPITSVALVETINKLENLSALITLGNFILSNETHASIIEGLKHYTQRIFRQAAKGICISLSLNKPSEIIKPLGRLLDHGIFGDYPIGRFFRAAHALLSALIDFTTDPDYLINTMQSDADLLKRRFFCFTQTQINLDSASPDVFMKSFELFIDCFPILNAYRTILFKRNARGDFLSFAEDVLNSLVKWLLSETLNHAAVMDAFITSLKNDSSSGSSISDNQVENKQRLLSLLKLLASVINPSIEENHYSRNHVFACYFIEASALYEDYFKYDATARQMMKNFYEAAKRILLFHDFAEDSLAVQATNRMCQHWQQPCSNEQKKDSSDVKIIKTHLQSIGSVKKTTAIISSNPSSLFYEAPDGESKSEKPTAAISKLSCDP